MSLLGATILTAITTTVLAVGAIATAVLAGLAFRKQSEEVRILQKQTGDAAALLEVQSDQLDVQRDQFESLKRVSQKQIEVLELQARELAESLEERAREAEDRRRSQAAAVTAWLDRVEDQEPSYAVVSDERQEVRAAKEKLRRRNALVGRVLAQCDDISRSALVQVRAELDAEFGEALREIDDVNKSVRDNQAFRSDLDRDISAIQIEAQSMLDRLGVPSLEA